MSYRFEFDVTNELLQGRLEGRVTSEELMDFYRDSGKCFALKHPRGAITDMSGVTFFGASPQTIRELASMRPAIADENTLRVIVAPSSDVFGLARMFESHGSATRPNLHVVRTCKEALAIVGVQHPQFEPLDIESHLDHKSENE